MTDQPDTPTILAGLLAAAAALPPPLPVYEDIPDEAVEAAAAMKDLLTRFPPPQPYGPPTSFGPSVEEVARQALGAARPFMPSPAHEPAAFVGHAILIDRPGEDAPALIDGMFPATACGIATARQEIAWQRRYDAENLQSGRSYRIAGLVELVEQEIGR